MARPVRSLKRRLMELLLTGVTLSLLLVVAFVAESKSVRGWLAILAMLGGVGIMVVTLLPDRGAGEREVATPLVPSSRQRLFMLSVSLFIGLTLTLVLIAGSAVEPGSVLESVSLVVMLTAIGTVLVEVVRLLRLDRGC